MSFPLHEYGKYLYLFISDLIHWFYSVPHIYLIRFIPKYSIFEC